jgi:gluconokinase
MGEADIIVMGVSGVGKSTVGRALAEALGRPFVEGDDYHSPENRAKMAGGTPLDNADREGWIAALCGGVNAGDGAVVACSALNGEVRGWLSDGLHRDARFVHLDVPKATLAARLSARTGHFFDAALLDSQFEALEAADDALRVSADRPVADVVQAVLRALDEH